MLGDSPHSSRCTEPGGTRLPLGVWTEGGIEKKWTLVEIVVRTRVCFPLLSQENIHLQEDVGNGPIHLAVSPLV